MTLFETMEARRRGTRGKVIVREKRSPSPEQLAVLAALKDQPRMLIEAGPGTGKTTLLEMIADELEDLGLLRGKKCGMLAFNKHVATHLKKLFPPSFEVKTVSSLGDLLVRQNCRGITFEPRKYQQLTEEAVSRLGLQKQVAAELVTRTQACLQLHVGHGLGLDTEYEAWADRMMEVDAPTAGAEEILYRLTHEILSEGLGLVRAEGVFSYLDQTFAPLNHGWRLEEPFDVLLIDELQDLSRAQLSIVQAATHAESRVIGVGDKRQSLYAFAGSHQWMMDLFGEIFGAAVYPLSVSFRCPQRVIEVARSVFPVVEAAPGAAEGRVDDVSGEEFLRCAAPGDLAIARTNAPLIEWCYQLVSAGVPAMVRGKDISVALRSMAKDAACFTEGKVRRDRYRDGISLEDFRERLDGYAAYLIEKSEADAAKSGKDAGMRIAAIADRYSALQMVLEHTRAPVMGGFLSDITELFKGDAESSVVLTTAHGAKGLEAETVWILAAEQFPCERATSEAELYAERCAEYVAYSRAKQAMYFVDSKVNKIPDHARGGL